MSADTIPMFIAWRFMEPLFRRSIVMLADVDGRWAQGDWDFVPPDDRQKIIAHIESMMEKEFKAHPSLVTTI